ncbi:MAG: F0F1 ATP synthase subunit A [Oscillospiraceae bacterium]|jgi:F-type H+-transporting ATPase subunit a|nr:F0F1 ATP synthase subunit A [Oscillospiraceae bacterium]
MTPLDYVAFAVTVCLIAGGYLLKRSAVKKLAGINTPTKKQLQPKKLGSVMFIAGLWALAVHVLALLMRGKEKENFEAPSILAERWEGIADWNLPKLPLHLSESISETVLVEWLIIAVVLVFAVCCQIFVFRKPKDNPKGILNVLELAVESIDNYIGTKLQGMSLTFGAYMFSLTIMLVLSAMVELFHLHAPTADLTMTAAISLITFVMINYYGFKRKGVAGRIRTLVGFKKPEYPENADFGTKFLLNLKAAAKPTSIVFPFRVLSEIIVPVSLTCRLFGNMFAGMVIIDLMYWALGNFALGIPSVAGLFFNAFHPLIQAFIFVTLTLSYIEEATAEEE